MLQAILKATTSPSLSLSPMVKESKGLPGCQKGRIRFHSQQNPTEKKLMDVPKSCQDSPPKNIYTVYLYIRYFQFFAFWLINNYCNPKVIIPKY